MLASLLLVFITAVVLLRTAARRPGDTKEHELMPVRYTHGIVGGQKLPVTWASGFVVVYTFVSPSLCGFAV